LLPPLFVVGGCSSILGLGDFSDETDDGSGADGGDGAAGTGSQASTGGAAASTTSTGGSGVGGGGDGGDGGDAPIVDCDNRIQDPGEGGVDCGGPCPPCVVQCPQGTHVCAPPPDASWVGPVALVEDATGCAGDFPAELVTLRGNLTVGVSGCDCNCGVPTVTCSKSMKAIGYSGANCTNPEGQATILENECYNQVLSDTHAVSLTAANASCANGTVTENLPAPVWGTQKAACGGFGEAGTCANADEVCVPAPAAPFDVGQICVYRTGSFGCPAGYPNVISAFGNFKDDRDCPNSCTCSDSGSTCKVTVVPYDNTNCVTALASKTVVSGNQTCVMTPPAQSMRPGVVTVQNQGTCMEGPANLTGTVEPIDPITVCCM
jgi:hypothetical protein